MLKIAALVLAATCLLCGEGRAQARDGSNTSRQVTLLMPQFDGSADLAANAAAVLNLQIWRTLRKAPFPNPHNLDFGNGQIVSVPPTDGRVSHLAALTRANGAQVTLWGSVDSFDDGVVVRATLVAPDYLDDRAVRPERWTVSYGGKSLTLPFHPWAVSFEPVVIPLELVQDVSRPDALQVCAERKDGCSGPRLPAAYRARIHDGEWSYVEAIGEGPSGWIHLPALAQNGNQIAEFTAGVVAYFRGDFVQAARLFDQAAAANADGANLNLNALGLRLASLARSGGDFEPIGKQLFAANPWSVETRKFMAMSYLDQAARATTPLHRKATAATARGYVQSVEQLQDDPDAWTRDALALLAMLAT